MGLDSIDPVKNELVSLLCQERALVPSLLTLW